MRWNCDIASKSHNLVYDLAGSLGVKDSTPGDENESGSKMSVLANDLGKLLALMANDDIVKLAPTVGHAEESLFSVEKTVRVDHEPISESLKWLKYKRLDVLGRAGFQELYYGFT
ncbi:hypothetical protein PG984_007516 [Apiospora sp. TS-2023a]